MNESNATNWSALKVYKELTFVITRDGDVYTTTATPDQISKLCEKSRFLKLWSDYIAVDRIKKLTVKPADEIDNALLQISDKNLRARVQAEVDERRRTWSRLNMEIYKNILDRFSK